MHTIEEIGLEDIHVEIEDSPIAREEVLPPITIATRLGVVMGPGTQGIGAGNFILAAVLEFYADLASKRAEFFEYPDFYTFQTGSSPAEYRMLDIYPEHKDVIVENEAETLLRAINDRAIDILLVPDHSPESPAIEDITRRSAERRLDACFLYGIEGSVLDPTMAISVPRDPVSGWYQAIAASTNTTSNNTRWEHTEGSPHFITQHFRRITREQALRRLPVEK